MKKILSLITLFICVMIMNTNNNVKAELLGLELTCNNEKNSYPAFVGEILECKVRPVGNVVYFKEATINYNFGSNFSLIKFVPNETWDKVTNIDSGVKMTTETGIPTNVSFGTIYVKVIADRYDGREFSVDVNSDVLDFGKMDYNVYIHDDHEKRLESVVINDGKLPINFDSDVFEYNLSTTLETLKFGLKTKNAASTTDVKESYKLNYGKNTIKIKVTDAKRDFDKAKVYTFNITRNDNRSDDNTLNKLVVCGNEVSLVKDQYDYSVNVGYDVEKAVIDYTLNNKSAKAELIGDMNLAFGKNTYAITVTSEKGNAQVYNISIIKKEKVLSTNNYLSSLEIKGHSIDFNKNNYNYAVKIDKEDSLDITVKTEDEYASYQILGNNNLKDGSVIYINVNSESGSLLTYSITVNETEAIPVQLIIICLLSVIIVVLVVLLIISKKKYNTNTMISKNNNN